MENAYLEEARAAKFGSLFEYWTKRQLNMADAPYTIRWQLVAKYAWAIPSLKALGMLAKHAPLVEIGAGTGYWAYLLRQMGVDIIAYDTQPPTDDSHKNPYHRRAEDEGGVVGKTWTDVLRGGTPRAARYPDRTLFLCWPPYDEPMAYNALRHYTGKTLAYIGEGEGGCTGDKAFHALLDREWEQIEECSLPQWDGIHDYLTIYRRLI